MRRTRSRPQDIYFAFHMPVIRHPRRKVYLPAEQRAVKLLRAFGVVRRDFEPDDVRRSRLLLFAHTFRFSKDPWFVRSFMTSTNERTDLGQTNRFFRVAKPRPGAHASGSAGPCC